MLLKVAAIQMNSSDQVADNLQMAGGLIAKAADAGAQLVVLPEMFAMVSAQASEKMQAAEIFGDGPIQTFLAEQAKKHAIWLVGGTILIRDNSTANTSSLAHKARAACLVYNAEGVVVARYDKIHLFDAMIRDDQNYQESAIVDPGTDVVLIDTPYGKLGLAVCYDIRFPELFRCLFAQGVEIIVIPAAFTLKTGIAHWELLARSRAVENFSYVIGACQGGSHAGGRQTYGHSLIVDPWGKIIATRGDDTVGVVLASIDLDYLHQVRNDLPVYQHRRIFHIDDK